MNTPEARPSARDRAGERSRLAQRLRRVIRGDVLFDAASRGRYASDASIHQVEPLGVVVPADEADVTAALELARELGVPVLSRGAGTGRFGQALGEALVIDLSRNLDRIVAFDPQARTVEVQPGITLQRLNAQLAPAGLCFPVDPLDGAQATLGGMAGSNACGVRSVAHGCMVHGVLGIDAVLADGTDEHFGPFGPKARRPMRSARTGALVSRLFEIAAREREEIERAWPRVSRVSGAYLLDVFQPVSWRPYTEDGSVNLAHLLVGSQGTLAHFRRLHLRLAPLPAHRVLGLWRFPSVAAAAAAARSVTALGPSAVELLDASALEPARSDRGLRPLVERALQGHARAVLLVEFAGEERGPLLRQLRGLAELASDLGTPRAVLEVVEPALQPGFWALHRAALDAVIAGRGARRAANLVDDCAVPVARLAEYVESMDEVLARQGVTGVWQGHAGIGLLHLRPLLDLRAGDAARLRAIAEEARALVGRLRGAPTGGRAGDAPDDPALATFGPRLVCAFAEVKALFDPAGRMNPGKIVPAPGAPPSRPMRMLPRAAPGTEELALLAMRCDGNGRCLAMEGAGAMCPSHRVTGKERDSPRGRANTLRLALAGRFGPEGLASAEVADAMALCVGCKACRSECPSGVDVARMKTEALASRAAAHGVPAGERLLASLPAWAPWASRLSWLANLRDRVPGAAALSARWLDLARRPLPRWRADTFLRGWRRASPASVAPGGPAAASEVLLFADCLHDNFDPAALHASVRVLRAAGVAVRAALPAPDDPRPGRPLCCGRSWLAAGLVDRARAEAARTVAALAPLVERGATVVGLEPSCLLTMRDEYRSLGLGEAAGRLAAGALLLEEFLVREREAGRIGLALGQVPWKRALVHGHCHQQALGAAGALSQVLAWVPGLAVEPLPPDCCGMGDGFGYRADRHAVSMRMAERSLLPAARAADAATVLVSDGFGCRRQVADGAQREAVHLADVLDAALASGGDAARFGRVGAAGG